MHVLVIANSVEQADKVAHCATSTVVNFDDLYIHSEILNEPLHEYNILP
jgi:hypothetical protein